MSFGSTSVATSVFVFTKSVGSVTVCAVAVVTVTGTSGMVAGATVAVGATLGGFFGHAGRINPAKRISVTPNALNDLLIFFLFPDDSSEWSVVSGQWSEKTFLGQWPVVRENLEVSAQRSAKLFC